MTDSSKTVILIGAGASAASDFHLPTMHGFFRDPFDDPDLERFMAWYYRHRPRSEYNLEEVLGYLDLARAREGVWRIPPMSVDGFDSPRLYDSLLQYVKRVLGTPVDSICNLHSCLFAQLAPQDTVLTLNYDLVADRALRQAEATLVDGRAVWPQSRRTSKLPGLIGEFSLLAGTPPSLVPWEKEGGYFVKLHGSLDWIQCPTPSCPNNANVFSVEFSRREVADGQREGEPCRMCGAALETLIVPPVASKRLDHHGRLAFLWHLACRELSEVKTIVVIGISLAASDYELRWLLRYAMAKRVPKRLELHVVNPDPMHREAIVTHFPWTRVRRHEYAGLNEYLEAIETRTV